MEKCLYCKKEFKSKAALRSHVGAVHKDILDNLPFKLEVKGKKAIPLDITRKELEEARLLIGERCNICGKVETANTHPSTNKKNNQLSIDHNHETNEFRGFLCVQCNRNLGWFEKYQKQIIAYNIPYKDKIKK